MLEKTIKQVLVTEDEISEKSREIGRILTEEYNDKNPLMVAILKGSVPFFAELTKRIDTHIEMDFMVVSSYHGGTSSSGEVKMVKDLDTSVEGRDIIIVEDIIDTGRTLLYLKQLLLHRKANSVKIVTLVDKPEGRVVEIEADYVGFSLPNEFLVGFGLDYDEHFRNLPYIGILKEEIYQDKD
ncbi:MAG: hypoxanthine phosphoribosyltransferase [Lactococcus plantarum]|nr:hypoxanthine phosphoribosyltransferase [Lactococcus plantarum]